MRRHQVIQIRAIMEAVMFHDCDDIGWSTTRPRLGVQTRSCENAKTLNRDRRSYSSKTVFVAQRASGFNLEIELKNIILRRASIFEFLHSQGHFQTSPMGI